MAGMGVCDAFLNVSIVAITIMAITIMAITIMAVTIMAVTIMPVTIMAIPVAIPVPISVGHAVVDKCTGFIFTELADQLRLQR